MLGAGCGWSLVVSVGGWSVLVTCAWLCALLFVFLVLLALLFYYFLCAVGMCWNTDNVLVWALCCINLLVVCTQRLDRLDSIFGSFLWGIFIIALMDYWAWALVCYTL